MQKLCGRIPDWVYEISGIILVILIGVIIGDAAHRYLASKDYQSTLIDIKRGHKVIAFAVDANEKIWLMTRPFKEGEEPLAVQFTDGKRTRIVFERRNQK